MTKRHVDLHSSKMIYFAGEDGLKRVLLIRESSWHYTLSMKYAVVAVGSHIGQQPHT